MSNWTAIEDAAANIGPMKGAILAEVVLTCLCSIASLFGGGFILLCYLVLPRRQHFRHALIINLAISDFVNALNNTASGLWIWTHGIDLYPGPGCTANAIIGQISVQATDCSILLIAVITLVAIRKTTFLVSSSTLQQVGVCLVAWILPCITGFTALGLKLYGPVGSNWCWIFQEPTYMRYVLTHMWRFLVIVVTFSIYIYIYFHIRKRFSTMNMMGHSKGTTISSQGKRISRRGLEKLADDDHSQPDSTELSIIKPTVSKSEGKISRTFTVLKSIIQHVPTGDQKTSTNSSKHIYVTHEVTTRFATQDEEQRSGITEQLRSTQRRIQRTLLLNGYPIAYMILWIPGIANRIAQATNHPTIVLGILQASTQLVGLANAITYGFNESMVSESKDRVTSWFYR